MSDVTISTYFVDFRFFFVKLFNPNPSLWRRVRPLPANASWCCQAKRDVFSRGRTGAIAAMNS